jgi:MerR family transcriptional regulator, heat shock protein HspR
MSDGNDRAEGSPPATHIRMEVAARQVDLPPARIRRYVQIGLVRPARVEGQVALFGEAELARLRKIRRLRDDLGLNMAGLEVALRLLDEIQRLQAALDERGTDHHRAG